MQDVRVDEHLWIPLSDGRRLAAKLWRPASDEPAPAILEYLPYRKRDGTASRDATTYAVFTRAGYAGVRVDVAGSGESDGMWDDEYSEQELSDGEQVIAWIAEQPWCSGAVGMIGISWGGFNGLQLAFRRPPALKAVVSVCSTVDRYADDIHYMGGCLLTDNFNWGGQMTAYQTRPPDPALREDWRERWLERIDQLPFSGADWLRSQTRGEFWKHGSVCEDWSAIEAKVLAIGGWADAYVNAPPALAEHVAGAKALIGPWEHKYAHFARINPADFHGEVIGWFDRWLKGEENGAETLPDYRAFMQEHDRPSPLYGPRAGRWIAEAEWPSPNIHERRLHLTAHGLGEQAGVGEAVVDTSLEVGRNSAYFCPGMRIDNELADDQAEDDALSACFDLELEAPREILGRPVVEFVFSANKPAAQLCFRLCDVSPDGVSRRVSYRALNLAHHDGHEDPQPLEPGKRYRLRFALNQCAHRFKAGHRLRLAISTSYWPVVWPSPEQAAVTLDLADSALVLPERRVDQETDAQAPGAPRDFPRIDVEELRPASGTSERYTQDGALVLETLDDYGKHRNRAHGLEVGSRVEQRYSIRDGDPNSARHEARWRFEFARGDWRVQIDSENVMTSDAGDFILERRVIAREGNAVVMERQWREVIPRGLL